MPIRIRLAQSEQHIDQVFRLRHQVFCEEGNFFQTDGAQLVMDRFDTFPASRIFVALDEADQVVGSVRVTMDNPVGMPSDEYFDFRAHVPQESRLMSVGMFCVEKPHRNATVASGLLLMCSYYAMANKVDYACMPLNPDIGNLIRRVGGKPVTEEEQIAPHLNVGFVPYLLHIDEMNETFVHFAKQNIAYNMIQSYECMIFKKGEQIIRKGDIGDCAYVIVNGSAVVLHPKTSMPMAELSEGDVFGELALFSSCNMRTADVVASSAVRAMVLPQKVFLEHIKTSPEASLSLLSSMSSRMKSVLAQDCHDGVVPVEDFSAEL